MKTYVFLPTAGARSISVSLARTTGNHVFLHVIFSSVALFCCESSGAVSLKLLLTEICKSRYITVAERYTSRVMWPMRPGILIRVGKIRIFVLFRLDVVTRIRCEIDSKRSRARPWRCANLPEEIRIYNFSEYKCTVLCVWIKVIILFVLFVTLQSCAVRTPCSHARAELLRFPAVTWPETGVAAN